MQREDKMKPMLTKEEREEYMQILRKRSRPEEELDKLRNLLLEAMDWDTERYSRMSLERIYAELIEESPNEMEACDQRLGEIMFTAKDGDVQLEEEFAVWEIYMQTMAEHPDWKGYEDGLIGQIQDEICERNKYTDDMAKSMLGPEKEEVYDRIKNVLKHAAENEQRVTLLDRGRVILQIEPLSYKVKSMIDMIMMSMQFLEEEYRILIFESFGEDRIMAHAMTYINGQIAKVPPDTTERTYNRCLPRSEDIQYLFF